MVVVDVVVVVAAAVDSISMLHCQGKLFAFRFHSDSRGARDLKIEKKWPESSRIFDYILS